MCCPMQHTTFHHLTTDEFIHHKEYYYTNKSYYDVFTYYQLFTYQLSRQPLMSKFDWKNSFDFSINLRSYNMTIKHYVRYNYVIDGH